MLLVKNIQDTRKEEERTKIAMLMPLVVYTCVWSPMCVHAIYQVKEERAASLEHRSLGRCIRQQQASSCLSLIRICIVTLLLFVLVTPARDQHASAAAVIAGFVWQGHLLYV